MASNQDFNLQTTISAGKKDFTVQFENDAYTLLEAGSIAAVIRKKDGNWNFSKGSYTEEDAKIIGELIEAQSNHEA